MGFGKHADGKIRYPFEMMGHFKPSKANGIILRNFHKQMNELTTKSEKICGVKVQNPKLDLPSEFVYLPTEISFQGPFPPENVQVRFTPLLLPQRSLPLPPPESSSMVVVPRSQSMPTDMTNQETAQSLNAHTNVGAQHPNTVSSLQSRSSLPFCQQEVKNDKLFLTGYLRSTSWYFETLENQIRKALQSAAKLNSGDKAKLTKLKASIGKFLNSIDNVQSKLDAENIDSSKFKEILDAKEPILTIYKKLKGANIRELLGCDVKVTDDHMICFILGLTEPVIFYLNNLDQEVRQHQTDLYWIQRYMEEASEGISSENEEIDRTSTFHNLGFNGRTAERLSKSLENKEFSDHRTTLDWAKDYIEDLFKYDILLNHEVPAYPFKEDLVDQQFEVSVSTKKQSATASALYSIKVINVGSKESEKATFLAKYKKMFEEEEFGYKYWFHGTDHKSAQNIMQKGIKLGQGKKGMDFSHGNGFYVSSDIELAYNWSYSKKTHAILVFLVENPNEFFDTGIECGQGKGKKIEWNMHGNMDDDDLKMWTTIIRYYRSEEDDDEEMTEDFLEELRSYKYIIGPLSKDGSCGRYGSNWKPELRIPLKSQLCIKDNKMAVEFYEGGRHICLALFLP